MSEDDPPQHVTRIECGLCREGLHTSLNAMAKQATAQIESLRREIVVGISVSTTLTGIFLTVLYFLLKG